VTGGQLIFKRLAFRHWEYSQANNSADPARASIGNEFVRVAEEMLDSFAIWPFTEMLGWTAAQVQTLTAMARAEMQDLSLKLYIPV
jgi:hypothetical protein